MQAEELNVSYLYAVILSYEVILYIF